MQKHGNARKNYRVRVYCYHGAADYGIDRTHYKRNHIQLFGYLRREGKNNGEKNFLWCSKQSKKIN